MSPGKYLVLVAVGLENVAHGARLACQEAFSLGRYGWWWRWRSALRRAYLAKPVFRLIRREGPETGLVEEDLVYGETPPLTAWRLLRQMEVGEEDHLVDLGCGRGTVLFVGALGFGAAATGVDVVGTFVKQGRRIAAALGLTRVEFRKEDFREQILPKGTIYFLSPTTLTRASWEALQDRMLEAEPGARVVSLTRPLTGPGWELLKEQLMDYTWGKATVHIHRRV